MADDNIYRYDGKEADVLWDLRLCIHVGECGRSRDDLFVGGRKPWCQPDLVPLGKVDEVVRRCPSGALSVERKDGGPDETPAPRNVVQVTPHGPLYVSGDLHIEGAAEDMHSVRFRAALCRCGQSKRKPFCDNSHEGASFKDYGAVGDTGDDTVGEGGPLEIKKAPDGPLLLSGNVTIRASSGRDAFKGTRAALCRCGHSKNKPFCDGAHKAAGFRAP